MRALVPIAIGIALAAPPPTRAAGAGSETAGDASGAIRRIVADGHHPWLPRAPLADVAPELADLYPAGSAAPLWLERGKPSPALEATLRCIAGARSIGLDPEDFAARRLGEEAGRAAAGALAPADLGLLDVALTVEWMRLLRAAHGGLVKAPNAGRGADLPPRTLDLPPRVRETVGGGDPAAVLSSVEPRFPGYARLKTALARQRALAAAPPVPEVPAPARKVEPGATWPGMPAVRARLQSAGELPPAATPPEDPERYDPALVDAVRRFQEHHALVADGVLGKETVAELNVPPSRRIRQLELSLERWRWLPDPGRRAVVVVLPRAQLWAVDVEKGATDLQMRTVVGESRSHATPMLASTISTVVFRPYWVPPPKILRQEILPKARVDPEWLDAHGMEIVARPEPDAETFAPSEDVLARVEKGELTLRQRPGPRNDLGSVKFVVPDAQCIALHGTPHGKIFALPHRERSHGCIRLEHPDALARWVLSGEPGWDAARIAEVAARDRSTSVRLREPVHVVFVYATASVDPDGTEHYVDDAYRLDARAETELARRRSGAR